MDGRAGRVGGWPGAAWAAPVALLALAVRRVPAAAGRARGAAPAQARNYPIYFYIRGVALREPVIAAEDTRNQHRSGQGGR